MDTLVESAHDPVSAHRRRAYDAPKRRRTLNYRLRSAAKQHAAQHAGTDDLCQVLGLPCTYESWPAEQSTAGVGKSHRRTHQDASARRLHLERDLKAYHRQGGLAGLGRQPVRHRSAWPIDEDEGIELARSSVPLPGDLNRLQRQPSLGREDAFCDATTFKGRGTVQVRQLPTVPMDDDAQVAELYRMGLLYDEDDKISNSTTLDLNNIYHDEPIYSIRPAKRARKMNKTRGLEEPLNLDLSFADLGTDNDLAQYLISPSPTSETVDGDPIQHESRRHTRKVSPPLRVIYELDSNTPRPSFDVDTSQPPDLVIDTLSDYDYFTDSDMDDEDTPSEREVDEGGAAATTDSGNWVLLGDDS